MKKPTKKQKKATSELEETVLRVAKWLDARVTWCKRSIAEPTYVAVVPGVPLEESALMVADLDRLLHASVREVQRAKDHAEYESLFNKWLAAGKPKRLR